MAGLLLALVAGTAACGTSAPAAAAGGTSAATTAATPADGTTRRIAEVEVDRQCTIGTTAFADEADLTTDLEDRLAAAGLTYAQWKDWHDALVDSPALVEQFVEAGAEGCPGA